MIISTILSHQLNTYFFKFTFTHTSSVEKEVVFMIIVFSSTGMKQ